MMEITTQSSQLNVHKQVIALEAAQKEKAIVWEKEKQPIDVLKDKHLLSAQQEKDEMENEKEEEERRRLLKDVIDESGGNMSPAMVRLLKNIQSKMIN